MKKNNAKSWKKVNKSCFNFLQVCIQSNVLLDFKTSHSKGLWNKNDESIMQQKVRCESNKQENKCHLTSLALVEKAIRDMEFTLVYFRQSKVMARTCRTTVNLNWEFYLEILCRLNIFMKYTWTIFWLTFIIE